MKTEVMSADHPVVLQHALDILKNGGSIVFPTDTVYGLASLPYKPEFVERLFTIKGRNSSRAIAILISSRSELNKVASFVNPAAEKLAAQFWPGPLTLVVERRTNLPDILSPQPTIGVRVPNHPFALKLLRFTGPLAVTSANISGQENTNTAQEVLSQLNGRVHLVIDGGRTPGGVPSTVVDCTTLEPAILRAGPVSLENIEQILSN